LGVNTSCTKKEREKKRNYICGSFNKNNVTQILSVIIEPSTGAFSIYYKNGDREYADAFHGSLSEVSSLTSTITEDPTISTMLKEMKDEMSVLSTKVDMV